MPLTYSEIVDAVTGRKDPRNVVLQHLVAATNAAIGLAWGSKSTEAINWGDLSCVSAERIEDQDGCFSLRVVIEEAAPGCDKFCEFVAQQLHAEGYHDVEVVTQW